MTMKKLSAALALLLALSGTSFASGDLELCQEGEDCVGMLKGLYDARDSVIPDANELTGWWSARCATTHVDDGTRLGPSVVTVEPMNQHVDDSEKVAGGVGVKIILLGSYSDLHEPSNKYDVITPKVASDFARVIKTDWHKIGEARRFNESLASEIRFGSGGNFQVRRNGDRYVIHNLDNPIQLICYFEKKVIIDTTGTEEFGLVTSAAE